MDVQTLKESAGPFVALPRFVCVQVHYPLSYKDSIVGEQINLCKKGCRHSNKCWVWQVLLKDGSMPALHEKDHSTMIKLRAVDIKDWWTRLHKGGHRHSVNGQVWHNH